MTQAMTDNEWEQLPDLWNAYCLFCETGKEQQLAKEISGRFDSLIVYPVLQEKHKSTHGVRENVWQVMLPSYLLIYSANDIPTADILRFTQAYRFLESGGNMNLQGSDRAFAEKIFACGGRLSVSQAILEGGKVKIIKGPLKMFEGKVVQYDRRNRNVLVDFDLCGKTNHIWMAFDFVEPV